jgi:hypothetical protein
MITSKQITATSVTIPERVFTATQDGSSNPNSSTNPGQTSAITTMVLCNTGAVDIADESSNTVNVNIYLVKNGETAAAGNTIVSNLIIPAGETVFFSDEKIILDGSGNDADEIWIGTSVTSLITATISSLPV